MELTIDLALKHGVNAHKRGQLQEAETFYRNILSRQPNHPDANHNLGVLAVGFGKIQEALPFLKLALETNPSQGQFWLSYADALLKLGQLDNARQVLQHGKASGLKGHEVDRLEAQLSNTINPVQPSIGNASKPSKQEIDGIIALYSQGQLQESLALATALEAEFLNDSTISNVLGAIYAGLTRYEEAITSYNRALVLKPDYAEAYSNLGVILKELGRLDEAEATYTQAIALKPDYAEAFNNLGNTLNELGKLKEALTHLNKAIELKPNFAEAHANLGFSLSYLKAEEFSEALAKNYLDVLDFGTVVRPLDIANPIVTLLKHHDTIKEVICCMQQNKLQDLAFKFCIRLSEIPLFIKFLEVCPIPDLEIESVLRELRRILLMVRHKSSTNTNLLPFQNALALQCFNNEFIYEETEEEALAVKSLEASLKRSFSNNKALSLHDIACLASYRPLYDYPWAADISPTAALELLFKRQVMEIKQEITLKKSITRLNSIKDDISLAVREQYEENPYPRWINTRLETQPLGIKQVIGQQELQVTDKITNLNEAPQILIAGCGTGQHSLGTASRFKNCHVTAIDLSLSSLAYAKRKTEEFGVTNIDYLQADILDLRLLGKQFDIIESVGVLHHMADPIAGWRVLTKCLKPGGLKKIGLYSESARQHIMKARDMIADNNVTADKAEMLKFRSKITKFVDPELSLLRMSTDFYSTSELRDLLFHVQEHLFTIPQISRALYELGLRFMGFEFSDMKVKKAFKMAYPGEEALYDLHKWHDYEISNPRLFVGMYQFWVQKL